ncbi:hypothetical protein BH18ACT9_BH18ACT9_21320 [soil metagenome]
MSLDQVRAIADAVLYEGYLLYPYRASSSKNQSRWQFGVLGPPRASAESFGEAPMMSMQCLLEPSEDLPGGHVSALLRFLQLQVRSVEQLVGERHVPVDELVVEGRSLLTWQEAIECEIPLPAYDLSAAFAGTASPPVEIPVEVPASEDIEPIVDSTGLSVGRIVRRRSRLAAAVSIGAEGDDGFARLTVSVQNAHPEEALDKDHAIRLSLISAHLLVEARGARFVSLLEPSEPATQAAARCRQQRCFPVLVGPTGAADVVLGSPIILYDYPEIAAESAGALFDSTEIDEILTLRVMTMTDAEKAEACATDPRAAEIIDRCDTMSTETLQQLHGVLRNPHGAVPPIAPIDLPPSVGDIRNAEPPSFDTGDVPWWDPASDESVQPEVDSVVIAGVSVAKGSMVRVHPSRRADAQDLFFADQIAKVSAVLSDVDGGTHIAVVLVDDPAADLHEWYGRYLYFAPDELEPLDQAREESRS